MFRALLSCLLCFSTGPLAALAADRLEAEDPQVCRVEGPSSSLVYPRSIIRKALALEEGSRATVSGNGRAVYLVLPPTFLTPGPSYDLGTGTKIQWRIDKGPARDLWPVISPRIVALAEDLSPGTHEVEIIAAERTALVDAVVFAPEPLASVHGVITTDRYSELLTDVRADLIADGRVVRSECVRNPANGSFVLLDLAPGSYRIRFSAHGWGVHETAGFRVSRPGDKVDLGVIMLPFDAELIQPWKSLAGKSRSQRTFNVQPGGSLDLEMELSSPPQAAWLVSDFKTIELKIESQGAAPAPKSHLPLQYMTFQVPAGTPHDLYALKLKIDGEDKTLPDRWPQRVCVREPLPDTFAVAGIGHNNTWGQETSEYLARMGEMAQLSGARLLMISNEVNAAYISGALKHLRIPYAVTTGNHTMSRWEDFFPQRSGSYDDGPLRVVTFGHDINHSWIAADELLNERPEATVRILACYEAHPPVELIRRGQVNLLFYGHGGGPHVKAGEFPPRTFHLRPPGQESMLWFPMDRNGVAPSVNSPADVPRMSMQRDGLPPLRVEYTGANDGSASGLTARIINDTMVHFPAARLRLILRAGRYSVSGAQVLQQFTSDDGKITVIDAETAAPSDKIVEVVATAQP